MSKSPEISEKLCMILQLCFWIEEKHKNHKKFAKKIFFLCKKMKFDIKEILFRILFIHPWYLHSRKYIFDLKFTIKGSVIMKWGHGCKIWDWSIILHYFAEYLTCMLTLGLRSYRSSNLVIDLKMWEKFETNLPVCIDTLFTKTYLLMYSPISNKLVGANKHVGRKNHSNEINV